MVLGEQRPRVLSVPPYAASSGDEAIALAEIAGVYLDDWQQFVLRESLGERPDGKWSAFEIGLCIARQNGKSELLVARQLAGLFVLGEPLQIMTAHLFDTCKEIFRRLTQVIDSTPELRKRCKINKRGNTVAFSAHGEEGIELLPEYGGCRIRYKARSGGGGRGFTADCLYLDEAMILNDDFIGAVFPTLSAVPNPQVWYAGSAGNDADPTHDAVVFARVRERGMAGDPALAWFEWSVDRDEYLRKPEVADDPAYWAQANPAMGIRITQDYIAKERRSMAEEKFCVERLGLGNWPRTDGGVDKLIQPAEWQACLDHESRMQPGSIVLAFDSTPDHSYGCVAAAGTRSDGLDHIQIVQYTRDTSWIPGLLQRLKSEYNVVAICFDSMGPVTALLPELSRLNIETVPVSRAELRQGCGMVFDGIKNGTLRHHGEDPLTEAVDGVGITGNDAWLWSRKDSANDICPLYAVTLALWGVHTQATAPLGVINLSDRAKALEESKPVAIGAGPFNQRAVSMDEALAL